MIDFQKLECITEIIDKEEFGLCDDKEIPYVDLNNPLKWIGIVKNQKRYKVIFTAIDNCIITDESYPGYMRCDCMISYGEHLYLIELKDAQDSSATRKAKDQLSETIEYLVTNSNFDIEHYKKKKAIIANRKKRNFQPIEHEEKERFMNDNYGFRLDKNSTIALK